MKHGHHLKKQHKDAKARTPGGPKLVSAKRQPARFHAKSSAPKGGKFHGF